MSNSIGLGRTLGTDVDVIYVWMQPYESARVGAALAQILRRPWVADLGDPWALDEMRVYPSELHRRIDMRKMRRLLGTAAAIVMSTPEAAARVSSAFPELAERVTDPIPNGFDAEDFQRPAPARIDGKFRIVHTGYLHTELGFSLRRTARMRRLLRSGVPGLDILTRSHVFLIEAIERVLEADPHAREVVELHLAGVMNATDKEVADRCPVARLHGYMTHAESIELMRGGDLLFLPMQNLPTGVRATIVPGKTYEYLASQTPILGALPDGDARDILLAAGNSRLCRPADTNCLADSIRAELDRFRAGDPPARPDPMLVARFEYRALAAQLAAVFESVIGRRAAAAVA